MALLSFNLSPEAVGRFYDSLVCLGKFSEAVTIEATKDRVCIAGPIVMMILAELE